MAFYQDMKSNCENAELRAYSLEAGDCGVVAAGCSEAVVGHIRKAQNIAAGIIACDGANSQGQQVGGIVQQRAHDR